MNYKIFMAAGIFDNPRVCIFVITIFIAIVVGIHSEVRGKAEAEKGVAKRNIANILKALLPEGEEYAWVYAKYTKAVTTRTRHHFFYAIAIQPEQMYVVPLKIAGDTIGADEALVIRKDEIGSMISGENHFVLYDKNDNWLFQCDISDKNNRFGVEDPISIYQEEEKAKFMEIFKVWVDTVNQK